jgi:hypothetical protein
MMHIRYRDLALAFGYYVNPVHILTRILFQSLFKHCVFLICLDLACSLFPYMLLNKIHTQILLLNSYKKQFSRVTKLRVILSHTLFRDVTRRRSAARYRRFGVAYPSLFQVSGSPRRTLDCLTLKMHIEGY